MKLMDILAENDDFAEYDDEWLQRAMESFPEGLSVSVAFDLTIPMQLQQFNLLSNTRVVRNSTSTWSASGSLNVFVQYYRVPPSREEKPKPKHGEGPGFKADEVSVADLESKMKQEDLDRELDLTKDVGPGSNPADTVMVAVDQKNDISTAEIPEENIKT